MNFRIILAVLIGVLPLSVFSAKSLQGTVKGIDGRPVTEGLIILEWANEGVPPPSSVFGYVASDGNFRMDNINAFAQVAFLTLRTGSDLKMYKLNHIVSFTDNVPTQLTLQITDIAIDADYYRVVDAGIRDQILNNKTSSSFPTGNLVVNSSFESEQYAFAGAATRGWVGYWGASVAREKTGISQFGDWNLNVKTTMESAVGQFQGAEYVITEEDPAFLAIRNANAEGRDVSVSAWVRAGTNAIGKAIVFDDIFFQGNDRAFNFTDNLWHKISYSFTNIQTHPNTFAFKHFGFSIHEQTPSADVFSFSIDNVQISVGTLAEQAPAQMGVDISDGNARVLQSEVIREDIVSNSVTRSVVKMEFDSIGRPWRTWLPFEENCSGEGCMSLSTANVNSFYQGGANGLPNAGGFAYSQIKYENDPLARIFQSSLPGNVYQPSSTHLAKTSFSATSDLSETSLGANRAEPSNTSNPVYSYIHYRDENGNESMQWKDQLGNLVKQTSYDPSRTGFVSSRNLYDDKSQLIRALPPISCEDATGSRTNGPNCVNPRVFDYTPSGQMKLETTADAGTVKSAYSISGLLRAKQNQTQANRGEFTVYKYNERRQLLERGLMTGNFEQISDASYLENAIVGSGLAENPQKLVFSSLNAAFPVVQERIGNSVKNTPFTIYQVYYSPGEIISPIAGSEFVDAIDKNGHRVEIHLVAVEYGSALYLQLTQSRNAGLASQGIEDPNWPYAGTFEVVTRNVYDGIANLPDDVKVGGIPFILPLGEDAGFSKGLLVAEINYNRHLASLFPDPRDRTVSTFYRYDAFGNVVTTFKYIGTIKTIDKRIQEIDLSYDRNNRISTKTVWKKAAGSSCLDMSAFQRYSYDGQGRISGVYTNDRTNCAHEIQVATYNYFPDGKVKGVMLGDPSDRVTVSYSYHIRGWMTNIAASQVICGISGVCTPKTIYSEDLRYDENLTSDLAEPQFNGSIAEKLYYLGKTDEHKGFVYNYDGLDRLLRAYYTADKSDPDFLDEEVSYLADGRIKTMKRGNAIQTLAQPYRYYSENNRLMCIDDIVDRDLALRKDRSCEGTDHSIPRYNYDADGNRVNANVDGGIAIEYDWRGLPWRFIKGTAQTILVYDAGGMRVSKIDHLVDDNGARSVVAAKHYVGDEKEIRESGNQEPDAEFSNLNGVGKIGRISQTGDKEFLIKDHLGSTVTTFSDGGNWGDASLYDYFPYGKQMATRKAPAVTETFTGKELDENSGLYYFGARYYDADIGMWISPDPERQFFNLYAYGSNPVSGVDDDGMRFNAEGERIYAFAKKHDFYGSQALKADLNSARNSYKLYNVYSSNSNSQSYTESKSIEPHQADIYLADGKLRFNRVRELRHELDHAKVEGPSVDDGSASWHNDPWQIGYWIREYGSFLGFLDFNANIDSPDKVYERDLEVISEAIDARKLTEKEVNSDF